MNSDPTPFGRYLLVERLAVGGMAELYRAVLPGPSGFQKVVAIKKILRDLARHQQFRKMFEHEGRIMAALAHRNLVQVFELGEVECELFLCLEFVPGTDLAGVLRWNRNGQRSLSPPLAAWIARELCHGLDYVHSLTDDTDRPLQIVHRDVNPHNVLLSVHGDVKLGDFGIAKSLVREVRTVGSEVKGKLEYLAPEQANSDTIGPQADLYAVGLILFEMLTSVRYIQGTSQQELLENAAEPTWRAPRASNRAVPPTLEAVVERALRPEPDKRFGSARAMAQALSDYLEEAPRMPTSYDVAALVAQVTGKASGEEDRLCPPLGTLGSPEKSPLDLRALATSIPNATGGPPLKVSSITVSLESDLPSPAARAQRRKRWLWIGIIVLILGGAGAAIVRWRQFVTAPFASVQPPAVLQTDTEQRDAAHANERPRDADPAASPAAGKPAADAGRAIERTDLSTVKAVPSPPPSAAPERSPTHPARAPGGAQKLDELHKELARQRQRLAQRGVQPQDSPPIDRLMAQVESQFATDPRNAATDLQKLGQEIDRLAIDRAFVERKIVRLQQALARTGQSARYADDIRHILDHAINNRFEAANTHINRVLDELKR